MGESEALAGRLADPRSVYVELQSLVAMLHDLHDFGATSELRDEALCHIHQIAFVCLLFLQQCAGNLEMKRASTENGTQTAICVVVDYR